jgi:hypothetical protein
LPHTAGCLGTSLEFERAMVDAIDAGQANGEVATRADNQHVRGADKLGPATYAEIGVKRQRVAEWRKLRKSDCGLNARRGSFFSRCRRARAVAIGAPITHASLSRVNIPLPRTTLASATNRPNAGSSSPLFPTSNSRRRSPARTRRRRPASSK